MLRNILIPILILIIIPFCMGLIPGMFITAGKRRPSTVYIMGFIESLALFQMVAVPVIINKPDGFPLIVTLYLTLSSVMAVIGVAMMIFSAVKNGNPFGRAYEADKVITKDEKILWVIALAMIVFQMIMHLLMQSFDGDDAYYVVESLLSTQTDTLYSIKPYTGLSTSLDLRHALATMPVWIAYISRLSGIHSTVVAHCIVGLVLIPVLYMMYYQCAILTLGKERKKVPIFLIFVSVMYMFGNVSIYTSATFMMTRTWQGKSVLANLVLLAIIWLLLAIYETEGYDREFRPAYWVTLMGVNIVAAMCSTASVFLVAMLIGVAGGVMSVLKRDVQIALRLMVTCVPLVAAGAMYLIM